MNTRVLSFKILIIGVLLLLSSALLLSCASGRGGMESTPTGESTPNKVESTPSASTPKPDYSDESKLAFEKRDDGYWVVGRGEYVGGDIVIPSTYMGEAVVGVADSAFRSTEENNSFKDENVITSITICEGVKYIGKNAFGCIKKLGGNVWLESVELPSSLVSIGAYAFEGCGRIEELIVPESVTTIGDGAFKSCSGLLSVTLPVGLTSIGESAFSGCSSLTDITLPVAITEIAPSTFKGCSKLESVTALGTVSLIGESAFSSCKKLTSFDFNEGLLEICESAFSHCAALAEISLPDSLTNVGAGAFYRCSSVKTLHIGRGLTVIPEGAFKYLTGLEELVIPDGVVAIGRNAFDELTDLKSLSIPKSVKSMDYCFNGTRNIENVYYGGDLRDWVSIDMMNVGSSPFYYSVNAKLYLDGAVFEGDIVIPEDITRINNYSFENYKYITSVSFPHDMEYIGDYAFKACEGLLSVSFGGDVAEFGSQIFCGCGNIKSVELGEKLTKTGYYMFAYCGSLEKLVIPSNVKYLWSGSFLGCGIKELVISEGVERIGGEAFRYMNIDVLIPRSVNHIQFAAFSTEGKISYAGTVEEWQEVLAEHLWNEVYAERTVYCVDGEVIIPHPYA